MCPTTEEKKVEKINVLLARIQLRAELINQVQSMNASDQTRIRLIEEGLCEAKAE